MAKKGGGEITQEEEITEEVDRESLAQEAKESHSPPELEELCRQLETKESEAKELHDRLLRQVAELENFKKRMVREKGEAVRYANEGLVRGLLPILDNLERAIEHAPGGGNGESLLEGIEMVLKGFLEVLNKHGVTQVSAKGEKFNPEKHEAIAQVESGELEPNTVVEEHHKGYYLFDRLIRPSMVSVTKPPETKEKKETDVEVEKAETDD
ncbi:MAG: nucleotide exchange factor GrpE [Candidatus Binatia bacterium]